MSYVVRLRISKSARTSRYRWYQIELAPTESVRQIPRGDVLEWTQQVKNYSTPPLSLKPILLTTAGGGGGPSLLPRAFLLSSLFSLSLCRISPSLLFTLSLLLHGYVSPTPPLDRRHLHLGDAGMPNSEIMWWLLGLFLRISHCATLLSVVGFGLTASGDSQ